jgi:hypothetical protein
MTDAELMEGIEVLGLQPEDIRDRARLEPAAMMLAQQVSRVLPSDVHVEALFSASTGRKGVVAGATDYLLSEGFEPLAAARLAGAAFGPHGVNVWDAHPVVWRFFQNAIGQSPRVPNVAWLLKNALPSGLMPAIGQTPEGGEE